MEHEGEELSGFKPRLMKFTKMFHTYHRLMDLLFAAGNRDKAAILYTLSRE